MTWSLKLQGGDLVKGKGNSLSTINGSDKVQQDLKNWILTEFGSDPFAPGYGSIIEHEENTIVKTGEDSSDVLFVPESKLDLVVSEVDRIISRYQALQLVRLQRETVEFNGRHTFSSGEIIQEYEIEYEQITDTLYVDVILTLLNDETKAVSLTVKGQNV
jgi:hypothetical protein